MKNTILIVEDEPKLSKSIAEYLGGSGYETHILDNGLEVSDWAKANDPILIVLDIMLPGKDGVSVCQELRTHSQVPIIMVTAKTEEIDRLIGLEVGADDYLCKPFSLRELVARIKAIMRRYEYVPNDKTGIRGLVLDKARASISYEDRTIELTAIEFNILERLLGQPGKIFNRDDLIDIAYGDGRIVNDRTVDSHMKKIRKKLREIAPEEKFVHSIYGAGYKFEP
ncbi:MAG: response regulator [Pseudomonadales bacterium]|nr:response regulator [Pseudomonadales bacterium]